MQLQRILFPIIFLDRVSQIKRQEGKDTGIYKAWSYQNVGMNKIPFVE